MGSDGAVSGWLVSGCMLSLGVLLEYVAHVRLDLEILGFSISLTSLTAVISLTALTSVTAWTTLTVVIILVALAGGWGLLVVLTVSPCVVLERHPQTYPVSAVCSSEPSDAVVEQLLWFVFDVSLFVLVDFVVRSTALPLTLYRSLYPLAPRERRRLP